MIFNRTGSLWLSAATVLAAITMNPRPCGSSSAALPLAPYTNGCGDASPCQEGLTCKRFSWGSQCRPDERRTCSLAGMGDSCHLPGETCCQSDLFECDPNGSRFWASCVRKGAGDPNGDGGSEPTLAPGLTTTTTTMTETATTTTAPSPSTSTSAPSSSPAPEQCTSIGCSCAWLKPYMCEPNSGSDDGSACFSECCCHLISGLGGTGPATNTPSPSTTPTPTPPSNGNGNGGTGDSATSTATADTTRYWDCCKPSCAWTSNVAGAESGMEQVNSCYADSTRGGLGNGTTIADPNAVNICSGGGDSSVPPAYMCADQQPFVEPSSGTMMAFAAANMGCCGCYELTFGPAGNPSYYNGELDGETMIVQVSNSGGDLGDNHFDIQLPGGGFGIYNGCASGTGEQSGDNANGEAQFSEPYSNWGERYGGVSDVSQCSGLPSALQEGCEFRFNDFKNADNPAVTFRRVQCPAALTHISGCKLADDSSYPVVVA